MLGQGRGAQSLAGHGLAALSYPGPRDVSAESAAHIWTVTAGSDAAEAQMLAMFGEGLHPNAEKITAHLRGRGPAAIDATGPAARFGSTSPIRG